MSHAPASFNVTPPILKYDAFYQVTTAFTGGAIGDIFVKMGFISTFNSVGVVGAEVEPFFKCWLNHTQHTVFDDSAVNISNLQFLGTSVDNSGVITAVNKVSSALVSTNSGISQISGSLSSLINLETSGNATLSTISGGLSSIAILNTANNATLSTVSSSLSTVNSTLLLANSNLNSANTLNISANTTLSAISASLSSINTAFTNEIITAQTITNGNNVTFSNVRNILISGVSLLGLGNIVINGINFPCTTSGNSYQFSASNKFSTNIVVGASGSTVTVLYTTG